MSLTDAMFEALSVYFQCVNERAAQVTRCDCATRMPPKRLFFEKYNLYI